MQKSQGFTLIELFVVVVLFFAMCGLFLYQKNTFEAAARDDKRKTDINTLYHNLEKVYYAEHKSYPDELTPKTLPSVQADTFKDPAGIAINETRINNEALGSTTRSTYTYEARDCQNKQCSSYILRANLEEEADYVRKSDHSSDS